MVQTHARKPLLAPLVVLANLFGQTVHDAAAEGDDEESSRDAEADGDLRAERKVTADEMVAVERVAVRPLCGGAGRRAAQQGEEEEDEAGQHGALSFEGSRARCHIKVLGVVRWRRRNAWAAGREASFRVRALQRVAAEVVLGSEN